MFPAFTQKRPRPGLLRAALGLAAACLASVAMALPDTDVSNKQGFNTDVIYQIFTDRFVDGDTANNPTGAAFSADCSQRRLYCGGDWKGITQKINDGYLTGMGITAIWISQPVENITAVVNYASSGNNTSYHGYWARDFKRPNLAYGTMTDFTNLIAAAHAKNIKVVIDFAPNHTSPAMETNSSFAENGRLYDNGTLLAGYTGDTNGYFHHNGGTSFANLEDGIYRNLYDLADINLQKTQVDAYFKQAIKAWLDLGIDGIRVDAVKHMPFGWQKNFMSYIHGYKPVFSFGEWFLGANEVDPANHYFANQSGMSLLDFQFAQKVRQVLRDGTHDMVSLNQMIVDSASQYAQVGDQVTFIDNHDMARYHTSGANARKLEQALAFTLTSRGVPAIYYGTEQYMTGGGDPDNRAKMPSFSTTTTAYKVIKALAPLRKSNPAIAYGTTQQRWLNSDIYIYERKFGNNVAIVAINRNLSSSTPIGGLITSLPAGSYTDVLGGLLGGNSITVGAGGSVSNFTLGAGAVAVWQSTPAISTPIIGHVGPTVGKAGNIVTIDGRGFGATKGTVYFGANPVTGTAITQWENTQIKVQVPNITPGDYNVSIKTAASVTSNAYNGYEVLSGPQVTVRFFVNNAFTTPGESVYLTGNKFELTNWSTATPLGALFNQVICAYPCWYTDVNLPANTPIEFKFLKKSAGGTVWEGGSNHTYTTPASGTGSVTVNWQN